MKKAFKQWWDGTYIPPENYPDSGLAFMMGSYRRHWTSWLAHTVADFWLKHWQWCFSATFATIGLVIAAMKL
jgi:hypothetical protein